MTTLATLTGSEKQITWATEIRAKKMETFEKLFATIERDLQSKIGQSRPNYENRDALVGLDIRAWARAIELIAELRDRQAAQTSAAWWIDHRMFSVRGISSYGFDVAAKDEKAKEAFRTLSHEDGLNAALSAIAKVRQTEEVE